MSELQNNRKTRRDDQAPQSAKLLRDFRRLDAQRKRHLAEVAVAFSQATAGEPPARGEIMTLIDNTGTLLADLEAARDAIARALQSYHRHAAAARAYAALARK